MSVALAYSNDAGIKKKLRHPERSAAKSKKLAAPIMKRPKALQNPSPQSRCAATAVRST
jgi:hypothetical protein